MLMLYKKPIALDRERHRHLRLQRHDPVFDFARDTNSVPLAGVEFSQAAGFYPIIFAGVDGDNLFPAALLGLQSDQNLFVDETGNWDANYVPAYVRRYPFVLATPEGAEADNFTVCIDETFEGLTESGHGEDLFEENGEPAPFLQRAMNFLTDYQQNLALTERFTARLSELELLVERSVDVVSAGGQRLSLTGVYLVDEQKLAELDDAVVLELFRAGFLAWIHAHLFSLSRIQHLSERFSVRFEGGGEGTESGPGVVDDTGAEAGTAAVHESDAETPVGAADLETKSPDDPE